MSSPPLVVQRERRANAGNRMRVLLDNELEVEEMFAEEEDDVEFVGQGDEEDVFESDFASTEEEMEDDEEAHEKAILREEKATRTAARKKATRTTTTSLFTAKPAPKPSEPRARPPKRVSIVVPAESSVAGPSHLPHDVVPLRRRQSSRSSTRMAKLKLEGRLKEDAARKASIISRPKRPTQARKTQDQLIADALEQEERNTRSLKDFLAREEEKKRAARVIRKTTHHGGVVGFISRAEELVVPPVQVIDPPAPPVIDTKLPIEGLQPTDASPAIGEPQPTETLQATEPKQPAEAAPTLEAPERVKLLQTRNFVGLKEVGNGIAAVEEDGESDRQKSKDKLPWPWWEEMAALFGDHVDWGTLKVVPSRNRPIYRRPPLCPMTGLPALYRDPQTGIPYANAKAYRTLQRLTRHEFVWSAGRGVYWADETEQGARGVPASWNDYVRGTLPPVEAAPGQDVEMVDAR